MHSLCVPAHACSFYFFIFFSYVGFITNITRIVLQTYVQRCMCNNSNFNIMKESYFFSLELWHMEVNNFRRSILVPEQNILFFIPTLEHFHLLKNYYSRSILVFRNIVAWMSHIFGSGPLLVVKLLSVVLRQCILLWLVEPLARWSMRVKPTWR